MITNLRTLYPAIEPSHAGRIKVSDLHEMYWEESGTGNGIPVIVLHGGPGGGSSSEMRRFFDPKRYRIIMFDQRGSGRSTPSSELRENTTWNLISDIETLRKHLKIEQWLVFGGSWGSTLSLAYAATYPEKVLGLVLRGIFLLQDAEIEWFYQKGASFLFPDAYERYIAPIPEDERDNLLQAFYKRLTGGDTDARRKAARAWAGWEGETLSLKGINAKPLRFNDEDFYDAFARIECHYFINKGFFETDGWLLKQAHKYRHLPGIIVHGRYDVVTPLSSAWALHKVWPKSELNIIPDAGHSSLEPGIVDALICATDKMVDRIERV